MTLCGRRTQENGRFLRHIVPIEKDHAEQLGGGSSVTLVWHNEEAFHEHRADFLSILCYRNDERAETIFCGIDEIEIPDDRWRVLSAPRFTILPDKSHLPEQNVSEHWRLDDHVFEHIRRMYENPEPVAALSGLRAKPWLRVDEAFMAALPGDREAEHALTAAFAGRTVAVVSGGDPGVFGMAAAVCEALERGPAEWRQVEIAIIPGVSAMLAVAARVGAPLGHDFCAISLSDNLKPWDVIEQRLELAATAGFVIALYNPISRARPWQLDRAFEKLRTVLADITPVVFGRAAGRPDERISIARLSDARGSDADMATCIIIGSAETRLIERPGKAPLVYTPRGTSRPAA